MCCLTSVIKAPSFSETNYNSFRLNWIASFCGKRKKKTFQEGLFLIIFNYQRNCRKHGKTQRSLTREPWILTCVVCSRVLFSEKTWFSENNEICLVRTLLTVGSDTRGHDGVEEGLLPQNRQDVRHVSENQDHSIISVPIKNYKNTSTFWNI